MENNSDLNFKVNELIGGIFDDAIRVSIKHPAMGAFFIKAALGQKKAAALRQRQEDRGVHVPPVMILSVTDKCNLRCSGCYSRLVPREHKAELSEAKLRDVLGQASELGISIVLVVGGEPLIRPEIFDIMSDFPDMIFALFTNGTLIDETVLGKLKKQRHIVPFLSMEGDENITDLRRGAGIHGRLVADMAKLNKNGIFFGASITVTRSNYDLVTGDAFIREMRSLGSRAFIFVEYNPVREGTEDWVVTDRQREEILQKMADYRARQPGVYIGFPGDEKLFGGCLSSGRGFIHVSASGDVEPCPFAPYSDSSIIDMPLEEALGSKLLRTLRDNHGRILESNGGCALWKKPAWARSLIEKA